ncbi:cytochrome P450 [Streptomyces sp. NPDC047071]|uniref:cytochrome P450 n=1 Tax=Streptomyces sp. NPDC047071 TaxID=3154808 RepID=UPI0034567E88
MHRLRSADGVPVWLVVREAEVRAGLVDRRLGADRAHAACPTGFALPAVLEGHPLNRDGADHARLRRFAAPEFTVRWADTRRARVEYVAARLAADLLAHRRTDLVARFAIPLPLTVTADLLGVPHRRRAELARHTHTMLTHTHPEQLHNAVCHVHRLLADLISIRRRLPGGDVLSAWTTRRDRHRTIGEDELLALAFQLWWAGIENTAHVITRGTHLLLDHPDQARALRAAPALLPAAIEEILRHCAPTAIATRHAREDLTIAGTPVPAGGTVVLALASAHHGPARRTHLALAVPPHRLRRRTSLRLDGMYSLPVTLTAPSSGGPW